MDFDGECPECGGFVSRSLFCEHCHITWPRSALCRSTERALAIDHSEPEPECPHGGDCGCAIGSRHFWYESYCDLRLKNGPTDYTQPVTAGLGSDMDAAMARERLALDRLMSALHTFLGSYCDAVTQGVGPSAGERVYLQRELQDILRLVEVARHGVHRS